MIPNPSPAPAILPTPRSVGLQITGACNLSCRYCFYADFMERLDDLPQRDWLAFFEELGRLGVFDATLSGGEPFVRRDLFNLIDGIVENRMRYCILSNGTLIDERMIERFEVGKRRLRLDYIQVSIDGSRAEVHDKSRPASFDRAQRGLRLLKEAGFPVTVRVTINRHNIHDLENIARLLLEEIGLSGFGTNEALPIGAGCANRGDMALTPRDQLEAMRRLEILQGRYPGRIKAQAGPQAKLRMFRQMELARATGETAADWAMGRLSACGCVFNKIEVLHDGTIVPCCMLPGVVLGHIGKERLADVWNTHPLLQAIRERRGIPMSEVEDCRDCEWNAFCNGSCPGLAHQLTGDFNRANPEDCYRDFKRETGGVGVLSS